MLTKNNTLNFEQKVSTKVLKAVLSNINISKLRKLDIVRNSAKHEAEDKVKELPHLEDGIRNFFHVDGSTRSIISMLLDITGKPLKELTGNFKKLTEGIINLDFFKLFRILVFPKDIEGDWKLIREKAFLEEMLINLEGSLPPIENEIKLLRIFLLLSNNACSKMQKEPAYDDMIQEIIMDIRESMLFQVPEEMVKSKTKSGKVISVTTSMFKTSKMLGISTDLEAIENRVSSLFLGTMIWDMKLIKQALLSDYESAVYQETKNDSEAKKDFKEVFQRLQEFFICFSSSKNQKEELKNIFWSMLKKVASNSGSLTKKSQKPKDNSPAEHIFKGDEIYADTQDKQSKPDSLIGLVSRSFEDPTLQNLKIVTYEDVFDGMFDGSLFIRLINSYNYDKENNIKRFITNLINFIFKLGNVYFSPKDQGINLDKVFEILNESLSNLKKSLENDIINKGFKFASNIMNIYMTFQTKASLSGADFEKKVLLAIKELVSFLKRQDQTEQQEQSMNLLFSLVTVASGYDIRSKPESKVDAQLRSDQREEIFLKEILPGLLPSLKNSNLDLFKLYKTIIKTDKDLRQEFKDPKRFLATSRGLIESLKAEKCLNSELADSLLQLMEGRAEGSLKGVKELSIKILGSDKRKDIESIVEYLESARNILNGDFIQNSIMPFVQQQVSHKKQNISQDTWNQIYKKIQDGTASSKDLFTMLDQENDKNGSISEKEFEILTNRLGFKLSAHRIKEIFANVKAEKSRDASGNQLNEKEFEQALNYLKTKNLDQALQQLGITPEILASIFFRLVLLLILVFVFIFFGIKAFMVGGTFGAVINSIFPLRKFLVYI